MNNAINPVLISKAQDEFILACMVGDIDKMKYCLTEHVYKEYLNNIVGAGFASAYKGGNLKAIQFLVDFGITEQEKTQNLLDAALQFSCAQGNLPVVDFILTSNQTKDKVNIHDDEDFLFRLSVNCLDDDMVKYFIFELGIEKTEDITKFLKDKKNDQVEGWFQIRELNKSLEKELLVGNDTKKSSPKI